LVLQVEGLLDLLLGILNLRANLVGRLLDFGSGLLGDGRDPVLEFGQPSGGVIAMVV